MIISTVSRSCTQCDELSRYIAHIKARAVSIYLVSGFNDNHQATVCMLIRELERVVISYMHTEDYDIRLLEFVLCHSNVRDDNLQLNGRSKISFPYFNL